MTALQKLGRHWPESILAIIVAALLIPVFRAPGFLLFLDWAWGPSIAPLHIDGISLLSGLPMQAIAHALWIFFSPENVQKILFAIPFFMLATGAIAFTRSIIGKKIPHTAMQVIALSAGIFAVFNNFTLNRIALGHIHLLLGYALSFWALFALNQALENPNKKRLIAAGVFLALPLLISIHYVVLLPIAAGIFLICEKQRRDEFRKYSLFFILPSAIYILAFIIIGYAHSAWNDYRSIRFDASAFVLQYPCTGTPIDIATLSASWRPSPTACPANFLTPFAWAALAGMMLYGMKEKWALLLGSLAIALAYVTKDITQIVPAWGAMRDSGKFISLLVIAESVLITTGTIRIYKKIPSIAIPIVVLLTVCAISLPAFSAFSNIVIPRQYPQSWVDFAKKTQEEPERPNVLFLPQKTYATFAFAGNTPIANPAPLFFSHANIISGSAQELSLDKQTLAQERISYVILASSDPRASDMKKNIQAMPHLKELSEDIDLSVWQFVP